MEKRFKCGIDGEEIDTSFTPAYVHSKCCGAHWEVMIDNGIHCLLCEKCGTPATKNMGLFIFLDENDQV